MNIWHVTDGHPWEDGGFCECVWAWGADEARRAAWHHYEHQIDHVDDIESSDAVGDCKISDDRLAKVLTASIVEPWPNRATWPVPEHDTPHAERRLEVLRLLGWRWEDESYVCERCECYALGMDEYRVCPECYTCRKCAAEEPNREFCEACGQ
ncbi:MAG: hypothetical protein KDB14_07305 [Planctomycetales bacterium]|nr:hypothetical protein [Planctomycetales bacterium]